MKTETPKTQKVHEAQTRNGKSVCAEYWSMKEHAEEIEIELLRCQKREHAAIRWGNRMKADLDKEIIKLEGQRDTMTSAMLAAEERLEKLSKAARVLWEEHKAFGEDMHDTEGVDYLGSDSQGHRMMREIEDEMTTITTTCPDCGKSHNPDYHDQEPCDECTEKLIDEK
jgi:DNA repair exonuclease SbcCD ATPase subunit